jgi:hypothetical protein
LFDLVSIDRNNSNNNRHSPFSLKVDSTHLHLSNNKIRTLGWSLLTPVPLNLLQDRGTTRLIITLVQNGRIKAKIMMKIHSDGHLGQVVEGKIKMIPKSEHGRKQGGLELLLILLGKHLLLRRVVSG